MNDLAYQVDANEVVSRMAAENAALLQRAVIAEAHVAALLARLNGASEE